MPMPINSSSGMRTHSERPLRDDQLLSQRISGVNAAQIHDSMNASAIGPAGDIRKPNPRGSSRRLTAESVARKVQNAKISTISRVLRLNFSEGCVVIWLSA